MKYILLLLFTSQISFGQEISFKQHVELGDIHWLRDYDKALNKSKKEKKPLFILFQEVPGCATCRNYGNDVLTHPLLVEAIETEFIPLCIFNNKKGKDLKVLNRFDEPSWNNPVIRILDSKEQDITGRLAGNYSAVGLLEKINNALIESGNLIPEYLSLLEKEMNSDEEEIYLSMYCFWTGEKEIANINGVIATQAGFMNGKEVVKVSFDKSKIDGKKIHALAKGKNCGDDLYTVNTNYRIDKESKYYLRHSPLRFVPMTKMQETKVNSAIAFKKDPTLFLSPRQLDKLELVKNDKNKNFTIYVEQDFQESTKKFEQSNGL